MARKGKCHTCLQQRAGRKIQGVTDQSTPPQSLGRLQEKSSWTPLPDRKRTRYFRRARGDLPRRNYT